MHGGQRAHKVAELAGGDSPTIYDTAFAPAKVMRRKMWTMLVMELVMELELLHQVMVRVIVAGINPVETYIREGLNEKNNFSLT